MSNKTLWIPPADEPVWAALKRLSDQRNVSQSRLVTEALKRHLPEIAAEPDPTEVWAQIASSGPSAA